MKKERNILKRYFLSTARSDFGPCMKGFFLLALPAALLSIVGLMVDPELVVQFFYLVLGLLGAGVALGLVNEIVCRLFVSYEKGSWLHLKIRPDGVVEDSGNPMWKGWVRKEVEIRRIWFPPIDRTHSVEVAVGPFLVVLEIGFQRPFDPQEVCDVVVRGYNFNSWLAQEINAIANGSAVVRQVLDDVDQPPVARLADFAAALVGVLRSEKSKGRLLSNIRYPIKVAVSSKAEFTID